jgi:hypothetical protein
VISADLLDWLSKLDQHASAYPGWARVLFAVTLVLVLVSAFVYAIFYNRAGSAQPGQEADEREPTDGQHQPAGDPR